MPKLVRYGMAEEQTPLGPPHVVAKVKRDDQPAKGRWAAFTPLPNIQKTFKTKRETVRWASNYQTSRTGKYIGVVVLNGNDDYQRFIPKQKPWEKFGRLFTRHVRTFRESSNKRSADSTFGPTYEFERHPKDLRFQMSEPYVVAEIKHGRHAGKWGIFTPDNAYLQEARPNKKPAVERAKEMSPRVGSPQGVVVLNKQDQFHRLIAKDDSWDTFTGFFNKARRQATRLR